MIAAKQKKQNQTISGLKKMIGGYSRQWGSRSDRVRMAYGINFLFFFFNSYQNIDDKKVEEERTRDIPITFR